MMNNVVEHIITVTKTDGTTEKYPCTAYREQDGMFEIVSVTRDDMVRIPVNEIQEISLKPGEQNG